MRPTSVVAVSDGRPSVIVRLGLFCDPRTGANQFVTDVSLHRDSLVSFHDVIRRLAIDVTGPSFPPSIDPLLEFAYPGYVLAGFAKSNDRPFVCHVVPKFLKRSVHVSGLVSVLTSAIVQATVYTILYVRW